MIFPWTVFFRFRKDAAMNILMTILTAALTFGFCYVIDKYFSHALK